MRVVDDMSGRSSGLGGWIIGAIVVIAGLAAWQYFAHEPAPAPAPHATATPAPAATMPAPQYPIGMVQGAPAPASTAPLPALDASDAAVLDALAALPGADGLRDLLLTQAVIPHIVATVDALPRHTIGSSIIPLRTPPGAFAVSTQGGAPVIDARNYARYDAYLRIANAIDTHALVAWYVHWYPLFQQAYRDLGYPHGYFNDRLIAAIDNMLGAPEPRAPVAVQSISNGRYAFADPTWESLSVGQKLMLRVGPDNETKLKAKLRELRALLVRQAPASDASTAQPKTQ